MTKDFHSSLDQLNKSIEKTYSKKKALILTTQASCDHPFKSQVDIKRYYGGWEAVRVCQNCLLGELETYCYHIFGSKREVPSVSTDYCKPLTIISRYEQDQLMYPMRFKPKVLVDLRERIGPLFDRYVNKDEHNVCSRLSWEYGDRDEDGPNAINFSDVRRGLPKKWFSVIKDKDTYGWSFVIVKGTFSKDYLNHEFRQQ